MGEVRLFIFLSPVHPNSEFFAITLCWNFSTGLDFHKGSLTCWWLSKSLFSMGFWTIAARVWGKFTDHCRVHSWDQDYQTHGGQDSSWLHCPMVQAPTVFTKALLSVGGCQIAVVERGIRWGTPYSAVLLSHLAYILHRQHIWFGLAVYQVLNSHLWVATASWGSAGLVEDTDTQTGT